MANLIVGYELLIKGNGPKPVVKVVPAETKVASEKHVAVSTPEAVTYIDYTVKAKRNIL